MPNATNCYLGQEEIERLIRQDRLYYEEQDGGLLIYDDEASYFLLYYYWCPDFAPKIPRTEKQIVLRTIFPGKKKPRQEKMDRLFEEVGFHLADRLRQVVKTGDIGPALQVSKDLFEKRKLRLVNAEMKYLPDIRRLLEKDDLLHVYEIPYLTDEEIIAEGSNGRFICVVNEEDRVVAFRGFAEPQSVHGYSRIDEEYKRFFGIALVIMDYVDRYALQHGLTYGGWISEANGPSISYHMKAGRAWGSRYMEYRILTPPDEENPYETDKKEALS